MRSSQNLCMLCQFTPSTSPAPLAYRSATGGFLLSSSSMFSFILCSEHLARTCSAQAAYSRSSPPRPNLCTFHLQMFYKLSRELTWLNWNHVVGALFPNSFIQTHSKCSSYIQWLWIIFYWMTLYYNYLEYFWVHKVKHVKVIQQSWYILIKNKILEKKC